LAGQSTHRSILQELTKTGRKLWPLPAWRGPVHFHSGLAAATVDASGCSDAQLDDDLCPGTTAGATVDANGCSVVQADADGDGHLDVNDNCPDVANGLNESGIPGVGNQTNTDLDVLFAGGATIGGPPRGRPLPLNPHRQLQLASQESGYLLDPNPRKRLDRWLVGEPAVYNNNPWPHMSVYRRAPLPSSIISIQGVKFRRDAPNKLRNHT